MDEEYVEQDLFGEYPAIPQWEAIQEAVIAEDDEDNGQSDFFKDYADGFI